MSNDDSSTPIRSALEAERNARQAVEEARQEATVIRHEAREKARRIEQHAEERVKRLHNAVDEMLKARRKEIESQGAESLRRLRHEAVKPEAMKKAIDAVVKQILTEGRE